MRPAKLLVIAVVALVLAVSASVALARQVALVVGNSTYAHIGRLPNPENDAVDLAAALRRIGFEVTTELDADRVELTEALRAFTRRSAGADVSLVFYAGHGLEMDGINYLVPVDARLERDVDVRYETVTLDDLLVSTVGARLRLVILDACRNNPLARSMQRTVASRNVSGGSFGQLDEDLLGDETLVAYAAAAGTTAADGTGRNSPYTSALLAHLDEPLEILTLFRRVRARVLEATNGEQRPHEYQSLLREHYLSGATAVEAVTAEAAAPDVADVDVTVLDVAQLLKWAERGEADAQSELGRRYEVGRDGVERDYSEAVSWYRRAAEQGHAQGQTSLGAMYGSGRGVSPDDAEAVRWYRRAAEQGFALAQTYLGSMYRSGRGGRRDDEEAIRWFRRSAEQGHALGQAHLGIMYRDGRGVSRDDEEAVRWFRASAEQGRASGQVNLGWMYEQGRGVSRDRLEAARWYRLAADQGHADAQKRLDGLR
jgi:TPR repeat protein